MTERTTYYDVLGITRTAPSEIVTAVYRAWMKAMRVHPDLGGDESLAKDINEAYEILGNPESRSAYDAGLARERGTENEGGRRAPRIAVRAEIAYCKPSDSRWIRAETVDASTLGLKIRSREILEIGSHLTIAFPGHPSAAIEATVRWSQEPKRGGGCEYGVEFFSPVPHIMKMLL